MKTYIGYVLAYSFLVGIVILTWYIFFCMDLISDSDKRLAGIISLLGLGFGLFQFWINELNIERRKLFDLRFETYKEIILQIDSISENLNISMSSKKLGDIHGLVSLLMNKINRVSSLINMNKDFLFPGLHLKQEGKVIEEILVNILKRTDEYRIKIEKTGNEKNQVAKEFIEIIEDMNWHNDIREYLKELHNKKYDFYKIIRTYL